MGFRVMGLGFRVQGLGLMVYELMGLGLTIEATAYRLGFIRVRFVFRARCGVPGSMLVGKLGTFHESCAFLILIPLKHVFVNPV